VLTRQQVLLLQGLVDRVGHLHIARGGWSRFHVSDQIGLLCITSFGQVNGISGPIVAAFGSTARLHVVGRHDQLLVARQVFFGTPFHLTVLHIVLLDPDPAQDVHGGNLSQPLWGTVVIDRFQQMIAICANRFSQGLSLAAFFFGKAARATRAVFEGILNRSRACSVM
jgi:hypothetical protein